MTYMSNNSTPSLSFLISQWTVSEDDKEFIKDEMRTNLYEIIRPICQGNGCSLEFDNDLKSYITKGDCMRKSMCTELRIIKDSLYLEQGTISETLECINFDKNLNNWDIK